MMARRATHLAVCMNFVLSEKDAVSSSSAGHRKGRSRRLGWCCTSKPGKVGYSIEADTVLYSRLNEM